MRFLRALVEVVSGDEESRRERAEEGRGGKEARWTFGKATAAVIESERVGAGCS